MSDANARRLVYGHSMYERPKRDGQHIISTCIRPDVWAVVQQLQADHGLTISGAAHHLMRLGAGLQPLYPFSED
jgi:hypothetical protein